MNSAEKILVRGVNWLGDAVMTTPALQRLREARPRAHLTLLTPDKLAGLWTGHPAVDAVLNFAPGEGLLSLAGRLRRERFDTAVVLPNSPRSALEVFLARIPERIGLACGGRSLLLTRALPRRAGATPMHKRSGAEIRRRLATAGGRETFAATAHHVHDYLHIVAALGAHPAPTSPLLHVSAAESDATLGKFQLDATPALLGINPGAEYGPAKRWPTERFVDVAAALHREKPAHWVLFGGKSDVALTTEIAMRLSREVGPGHVTDVAGRTSLRELCALLKACRLLLTNDTGPMHVAAAVGTPVVVPFGSTSPELTGPAILAGSPHRVIAGRAACAPCFRRECPVDFRCLRDITARELIAAARDVLARTGP